MGKLYVHDFFPIHTHALADALSRLFVRIEVTPLIKLVNIKDSDAKDVPDYLLVNADSYIHSRQIMILQAVLQRLNNVRAILVSDHPVNLLMNVLQLNGHDRIISGRVPWIDFARTMREIIEPINASDADEPVELIKLTKRQKQILILSQQGKKNKEIADILNVSEYTVKVHAWRLYQRLKVNSRLEALAVARKMGAI